MSFNKLVSILICISAVTVAHANSDVCIYKPGNVECGYGKTDTVFGNGSVRMLGTTVEGSSSINGSLNAENAKLDTLVIRGSAALDKTTIKYADIKGSLNATRSRFENDVEIYSNKARFVHSTLDHNLNVRETDGKVQEIYLEDKSSVRGDINFEGKNGKVYIRGHSKIHGQVIGGEVIYK